MYTTTQAPVLISSDWILDALRTVRDRLQSLDADKLVDARDGLALALSEAIGGLSVAPARVATTVVPGNRRIDDGPDDFDACEWPAFALPPISGGSPDYEPTTQDWAEFGQWSDAVDLADRQAWMDHTSAIAEGVDSDPSHFDEADARAAGLAV